MRVRPEPSAFTAYISRLALPPAWDENAMRRPSGDQDGYQSLAALLVMRVTPEPSAFIAYISLFPSLRDPNAMRRPSGDHAGTPS